MGCCKFSCAVLALLIGVSGYFIYDALYTLPDIPDMPRDQWWGPGTPPKQLDTSIRPFRVEFKPEKIAQLKERLKDTTWLTEPLEEIGFQYGFNNKYLKEVIDFWRTKYNFKERQNMLNRFPQFKTNIQGLDIHFIHMTQPNPKNLQVVPLLLLHGWPGSFVEFQKMIVELSSKENQGHDFVFSIVVPSLPGYGYSQGASKPGLACGHMSVIMNNLMERLGYTKYVVQGGDWGSMIGKIMGILYPDRVIGYHTNMPFSKSPRSTLIHFLFSLYPTLIIDEKYVSKMYPISDFFAHILEETGYMHLQATKPDTIGVSLRDSPIGLAAYILEKFSTWTDREFRSLADGGLTKKYDISELLDNIMIYWDSGCITTSMRLYSETFSKKFSQLKFDRLPILVPAGILRASNEIAVSSRCQIEETHPYIVRFTDADDVGHFAAFQEPKIMAREVLASVEEFLNYHGTNPKIEL